MLSYQQTSFYNATEEQEQQCGVVAIGTLLDYIFDYKLQFVEENSGKHNSHLKTGLEFESSNDF